MEFFPGAFAPPIIREIHRLANHPVFPLREHGPGRRVLDIQIPDQDRDYPGIWEPALHRLINSQVHPLLPHGLRTKCESIGMFINFYDGWRQLNWHKDGVTFQEQFVVCIESTCRPAPLCFRKQLGLNDPYEFRLADSHLSVELKTGDAFRWSNAEQLQWMHGGLFPPGRKTIVIYYL